MRRRSLAALALSLGAAGACGGGADGEPWPVVALRDVDGTEVTSAQIVAGGRPVIVALWATTCAPCKEELPRLQALAGSGADLTVAAVNLGDEPGAIAPYVTSLSLTLPLYIDHEGRLSEALGVVSLPATIFVRPDGTIADRHLGALSADQLADKAAQLTDPAPPP